MKPLFLTFFSLILCMCTYSSESDELKTTQKSRDSTLKQSVASSDSVYNIEQHWRLLKDSVGGCLTGGQYCRNGRCGSEGCCFDINQEWQEFFQQDKNALTTFLVGQLDETSETSVHACPFFNATEGELAVYGLQRIHEINWYELAPRYQKYSNWTDEMREKHYSMQRLLRKKLKDSAERKLIRKKWLEQAGSSDPEFKPDTTVGSVSLLNPDNVEQFLGKNVMEDLNKKSLPYTAVLSNNKKQRFTFYFHPGNRKKVFSEFKVEYVDKADPGNRITPNKTFETESNVKLGISPDTLKAIKGPPDKITGKEVEIWHYYIDDYKQSDFLQRYNMPAYYADYTFKNSKLIEFRFGFEYP